MAVNAGILNMTHRTLAAIVHGLETVLPAIELGRVLRRLEREVRRVARAALIDGWRPHCICRLTMAVVAGTHGWRQHTLHLVGESLVAYGTAAVIFRMLRMGERKHFAGPGISARVARVALFRCGLPVDHHIPGLPIGQDR
jgi:hypothetical protein